jgi:hypothetical protein
MTAGLGGLCQPKLSRAVTAGAVWPVMAKSANPFHYFDSSPEVIRLVVMMYVNDGSRREVSSCRSGGSAERALRED